jgi:Amt family ammonium transporter
MRMRTNMRNPVHRKNVILLMTGKAIGLSIVFGLMLWAVPQVAHAQDASDPTDLVSNINATNTAWTLIAAFLVFAMQVGFVMLEAGFARERESVNILVEGIADTCICGIFFWAIGFAFMFEDGSGTHGLIGTHGFFLQNLDPTYGSTGVPLLAFWVFQFAFADTASTITSGAMVGRCGFIGDLLYSVGVTGFIYPIVGHWAWGPDGWLALRGFHDFAGSTVVHTIGGTISLAGAIALGPRLGRVFRRDGGGPMPPHNIIIGAVGGLILWFGWYGFNPGSTLSALDAAGIGRVSFNTTLAACSAGLTGLFFSYARSGKWDLGLTVNGFLAGLVAITCPCYWVQPVGAFFIGIIGAGAMIIGLETLEYLRIDDPIGAVPARDRARCAKGPGGVGRERRDDHSGARPRRPKGHHAAMERQHLQGRPFAEGRAQDGHQRRTGGESPSRDPGVCQYRTGRRRQGVRLGHRRRDARPHRGAWRSSRLIASTREKWRRE